MTTTTLNAPPQKQDVQAGEQASDTIRQQTPPSRPSGPPIEELDSFRGLIDGLLLALPFWLIVALLIAVV